MGTLQTAQEGAVRIISRAQVRDQAITRANVGWMYLERHPRGKVECIECRGCTMRRASGTPLQLVLQRHGL